MLKHTHTFFFAREYSKLFIFARGQILAQIVYAPKYVCIHMYTYVCIVSAYLYLYYKKRRMKCAPWENEHIIISTLVATYARPEYDSSSGFLFFGHLSQINIMTAGSCLK